jgi:hypothetical protein
MGNGKMDIVLATMVGRAGGGGEGGRHCCYT